MCKKHILYLCYLLVRYLVVWIFFKVWILLNDCLVYRTDLDLGYAKTGEAAPQPKAEPNWKTVHH